METNLASLQAAVDTERSAYHDAYACLERNTRQIWADGKMAAVFIISYAEEFGSKEAILRVLENAEQFGGLAAGMTDPLLASLADMLEEAIEATLETQDRLDHATVFREAELRKSDPGRLAIINIHGREYYVDPARSELRAVDDAAVRVHVVGLKDPDLQKQARSLADKLARDEGAKPPQPTPSKDRGRQR